MSKSEKHSRAKRPRGGDISETPSPVGRVAAVNYQHQFPASGSTRRPSQTERRYSASTPRIIKQKSLALQPPPGKVAIPALTTPQAPESSRSFKKGRIPHACDYCRKAKAGCSGQQPCMRCKSAQVPCVYGDGKRDKEKKRLSKLDKESVSMMQRNDMITRALRRLRDDLPRSSDDVITQIDMILALTSAPISPGEIAETVFDPSRASSEPEELDSGDDDDAEADVGSINLMDNISLDPDRLETRATGLMGKSSSVSWMKRTAEESEIRTANMGSIDTGFVAASYFTVDADLQPVNTSAINMYDWPEPSVADTLVELYFEHVHHALPIVDKVRFRDKYRLFARGTSDLEADDVIWLGTLNAIFAIGAVYSDLTKCHSREQYTDHSEYIVRAELCLEPGLLHKDARVSTVCGLGVMCLYFVATCRLNRAWTFGGLAMRYGMTLGLHARSEARDLSEYDVEYRVRVWWSLYTLECLLNNLTGRPSCISDKTVSTPLPMNLREEDFHPSQQFLKQTEDVRECKQSNRRSSEVLRKHPSATYQMPAGLAHLGKTFPLLSLPITSSTFFIYCVQIRIVAHEITSELYCAATVKIKWTEVQETIRRIDDRLNTWRDGLPPEFSINLDEWAPPDWDDQYIYSRMELAMLYHSTKMILFRPCLCPVNGHTKGLSERAKAFNHESAATCINSAKMMITILNWSSPGGVQKLYSITPWWITLHRICEALSILTLEMAFQSQHVPDQAAYILASAKDGIRWLHTMAERSISARKAWEIFDKLTRLVASIINWSVLDMPHDAPIPPGYNYRRHGSANEANATSHLQLSEANLQQYQSTLPQNVSGQAVATAWNQNQFGYYPEVQSFSGTTGNHGPGISNAVVNTMDCQEALQNLLSINQSYRYYDEPWDHVFLCATQPTSTHKNIIQGHGGTNLQTQGMMETQMTTAMTGRVDQGIVDGIDASAVREFANTQFDDGYGHFQPELRSNDAYSGAPPPAYSDERGNQNLQGHCDPYHNVSGRAFEY